MAALTVLLAVAGLAGFRVWLAEQRVLVCEVEPSSIRAAMERDEDELRAQSGIVRQAIPGWRVTTREAADFWAKEQQR